MASPPSPGPGTLCALSGRASHRQPLTTKGSCSPSEASAAAALVVTRPNSPIPKAFLADSLQALSKLPACGRVRREEGAEQTHQDPGMLCCPDSAALKGLDCLRAHVDPRWLSLSHSQALTHPVQRTGSPHP